MKNYFLKIQNLTKKRGNKKIQASFTLGKGKALALVGPSGCGKTTVLKMIAGLLAPDSGKILINDNDITNVQACKRKIGMVFQDYALFPHLSVSENIAFPLATLGVKKEERKTQVEKWLKLFDIQGLAKRNVTDISGGEKQRVALARTLITQPEIVLFDEPLSALDINLRSRLQNELLKNREEFGYTAIYVTHDLDEARFLADKIQMMQ
ncbi:MAG: thiamine ABC transporter ATP-binding protein [Treponema sp.]|nr:MAG: thiamine ABC transporter ATP-binding protein [Treponema sp.]